MSDDDGASIVLNALAESWDEIEPSDLARDIAIRVLRVHSLRAAHALQLAAALIAAERNPGTLPFVSLDDRLLVAADREGFPVVRPTVA
jgi:uncharacterized protein